jgi:hypothetical protein
MIFGLLAVAQAVRSSHQTSPWLWAFLAALSLAIVFVWVAYRALWTRDLAQREESVPIFHATGGTGGSAVGGGHAGGGGSVAYGPGSIAEGGKGGGPALTAFEALARVSLGMGYTLDEFIQLAGFDPDGPELDMIGRGGDGGFATDDIERPGEDGGPGLVVIKSFADNGTKMQVDVFRADGKSSIRPKSELDGADGGTP